MKKEFILAGITVILWSTLPAVSKLIISQLEMYALSDFLIMVFVMVSDAVT